ncbi:MAG: hypothetical protein IT174_12365 [Acidobacteria bacterium]|nr:hypothetical protein [Acidobacteriota bacterium]
MMRPTLKSTLVFAGDIRIKLLYLMLACFVSVALVNSVAGQTTVPPGEKAISLKVGQVWSYKTRPNEPTSTFVVVKIDRNLKYGTIVHIAVRDLKMKNMSSPNGISDKISHMPFSEDAIRQSLVKLLKEKAELPDFEEGYRLWKEAFNQERAGFYTISVAEAVGIAEKTLNQ